MSCPHCPDGSCPGPDSKDVAAWMTWIKETPRERLPAWAQRQKDARESWARWNPYGLFDFGVDIDDG